MGEANVLLEGASDQYLMIELIRLFAKMRTGAPILDLSSTIVMSAESAPGVAKILDASQWADERIPATVVLFDSDAEGETQRKRVTGKAKNLTKLIDEKFVVLIGEAVQSDDDFPIVTTEDLIPVTHFAKAVGRYIERWYPQQYADKKTQIVDELQSSDFGKSGNAADTQAVFDEYVFDKPRDYDKMGVIAVSVEMLQDEANKKADSSVLSDVERRLRSLLVCLRQKVEQSRHESQKESARQAIVRMSDDFFKRFKDAAEAFEIELHLDRIARELNPIGDDFAELTKVLNALLEEIREVRANGESLIEKLDWYRWSSLLFAIKKNPIAPEITVESNKAEPHHLWNPETGQSKDGSDEETVPVAADGK